MCVSLTHINESVLVRFWSGFGQVLVRLCVRNNLHTLCTSYVQVYTPFFGAKFLGAYELMVTQVSEDQHIKDKC